MLDAEEGRRRLRALAAEVGSQVDAVLCTAPQNTYFFTGFRTLLYTRFTGVLISMARPEDPVLVVSTVDRRLVEDRVWSPPFVNRVVFHGPDTVAGTPPTPAAALAPVMAGVRRLGVDSLRLSELKEVEQAAPGVQISEMADQIEGLKQIKGEWEIACLREANRLAMRGIEQAREMLQAGPTTELEISVRLEAEARLAGADGFGYPTLVSCGAKMLAAHSPALPRTVVPGQPLRIAFGPTVEGYTADVVRTLCLGRPQTELVRLQDGYLAARDALDAMIRPGCAVPEMMGAVRAIYEKLGVLGWWRNSIGHGLGLTIHEPPRISGASQEVLKEKMVVALEPNLVIPGYGGLSHCDVLLITASGYELLTPGLRGLVLA